MNDPKISTFRRLIAPGLGLAALLLPAPAGAAKEPGWSPKFRPVLLLRKDDYRVETTCSSFTVRTLDSPRSGR